MAISNTPLEPTSETGLWGCSDQLAAGLRQVEMSSGGQAHFNTSKDFSEVCVRPSHLPKPDKPGHGVHLNLGGHQF